MRDGGLASARSSAAIAAVRRVLRRDIEGPGTDRYLAPEIEAARLLVDNGALIGAAEDTLGVELL
jgi:histidine ammonia-lyase